MKTILLSILILIGINVSAQNCVWAQNYLRSYGGNGVTGITSDGSGNAYITGFYTDTTTIGGYPVIVPDSLQPYNYTHIPFVSKVEPSGQTDWVRAFPFDSFTLFDAIKADAYSNVYCSYSNYNYGSTPLVSTPIVTFDSNGITHPVLSIFGDDFIQISAIDIKDSFLYFAGTFYDSLYLDNITLVESRSIGSFIAKYNLSTNQYIWKRPISPTSSVNFVSGLIIDNSGNLIISGAFGVSSNYGDTSDTIIFDGIMLDANNGTGFIAKMNASGNYIWAEQYSGANSLEPSVSISLDDEANIYYVGSNEVNNTYTTTFVAKISNTGQKIWNKTITGVQAITSSKDEIYLLLNYDYHNDTLYKGDTLILNNPNVNNFMALDTAGNFKWLVRSSNQEYTNIPQQEQDVKAFSEISAAKNGMIYFSGRFVGKFAMGNSELINPMTYYGTDPNNFIALLLDKRDSAVGRCTIKGRAYYDNNSNCIFDAGDSAAKAWGIIATPGDYLTTTDTDGFYSLSVPPGNYTISELLPEIQSSHLTQRCPAALQYITGNLAAGSVDSTNDFANQLSLCGYVFITDGSLNDYFYLNYNTLFTVNSIHFCNYSDYALYNDTIRISLSDSFTSVSTNPPYDYHDTIAHQYVITNFPIPADSCIALTLSGIYAVNPAQLNTSTIYPVTISLQGPMLCQGSSTYDSANLHIEGASGLSDLSSQSSINVYPNPFQDQLFITLSQTNSSGYLSVHDITGNEIESRQVNGASKMTLDLSFLTAGAYLITYQDASGTVSKLIIKD